MTAKSQRKNRFVTLNEYERGRLEIETGVRFPVGTRYATAFDGVAFVLGSPQAQTIRVADKGKFIRRCCSEPGFARSDAAAAFIVKAVQKAHRADAADKQEQTVRADKRALRKANRQRQIEQARPKTEEQAARERNAQQGGGTQCPRCLSWNYKGKSRCFHCKKRLKARPSAITAPAHHKPRPVMKDGGKSICRHCVHFKSQSCPWPHAESDDWCDNFGATAFAASKRVSSGKRNSTANTADGLVVLSVAFAEHPSSSPLMNQSPQILTSSRQVSAIRYTYPPRAGARQRAREGEEAAGRVIGRRRATV